MICSIFTKRNQALPVLNPNREKFDLVSSIQLKGGAGPHWAHPSIYAGILYLRHGDLIVGYDIKETSYQ